MCGYLQWVLICFCEIVRAADPVAFQWQAGSLRVPTGFSSETSNYKEGIITTLSYRDGSRIILQYGGMIRIPLLQEGHFVEKTTDTTNRVTRKGRNSHADTCWREDGFKRKTGRNATWLDLFPPNIAYDHVPDLRRREFDSALDSFIVRRHSK